MLDNFEYNIQKHSANRPEAHVDVELLKVVGGVAGLAGVVVGALIILYKEALQSELAKRIGAPEAYRLLRLFLILVWSVAIVGIAAWTALEFQSRARAQALAESVAQAKIRAQQADADVQARIRAPAPDHVQVIQVPEGCAPTIKKDGPIYVVEMKPCPEADEEQRRRLAIANSKETVRFLQRVALRQGGFLLPALSQYASDPTEANWKTFRQQALAIAALIEAASDALYRYSAPEGVDLEKEQNAIAGALLGRFTMLNRLSDQPMAPDQAKDWLFKYSSLLWNLSNQLERMELKLTNASKDKKTAG